MLAGAKTSPARSIRSPGSPANHWELHPIREVYALYFHLFHVIFFREKGFNFEEVRVTTFSLCGSNDFGVKELFV